MILDANDRARDPAAAPPPIGWRHVQLGDARRDSIDVFLHCSPPTVRIFAAQVEDTATRYRHLTTCGPRSLAGRRPIASGPLPMARSLDVALSLGERSDFWNVTQIN